MKCVFLDCAIVNPGDISWKGIEALCEFSHHERTDKEGIVQRISDAEAVMLDAAGMSREIIEQCPKLRYIGIAATGFNHIDLEAAKERGVAVTNVPDYAGDAVAQHAIALLLYITNKIRVYDDAIKAGEWQNSLNYTFVAAPLTLLAGKSIGIVGYGAIGKRVGEMAKSLGMTVNIYSRDPEATVASDVLSLNCPLTEQNAGMINEEFIGRMKDGAVLINTARGGLVDEQALAAALRSGKLAAAGLDVLAQEPPDADNPLIALDNCVITPHIAFIPIETRRKIIDTCTANLESFINGGNLNRIV